MQLLFHQYDYKPESVGYFSPAYLLEHSAWSGVWLAATSHILNTLIVN